VFGARSMVAMSAREVLWIAVIAVIAVAATKKLAPKVPGLNVVAAWL